MSICFTVFSTYSSLLTAILNIYSKYKQKWYSGRAEGNSLIFSQSTMHIYPSTLCRQDTLSLVMVSSSISTTRNEALLMIWKKVSCSKPLSIWIHFLMPFLLTHPLCVCAWYWEKISLIVLYFFAFHDYYGWLEQPKTSWTRLWFLQVVVANSQLIVL